MSAARRAAIVETWHDVVVPCELEWFDQERIDNPYSVMDPVAVASSARVALVADRYGRPAVVRKRAQKLHLRRASGRECVFWRTFSSLAIVRTNGGMVVETTTHGTGISRTSVSRRLFGNDADDAAAAVRYSLGRGEDFLATGGQIAAIRRRLQSAIGPAPIISDRFPLLASADSDGFAVTLKAISHAPAHLQDPWLDAVDAAQVARKLYGARAYRRPMAREVARLDAWTLHWYSLFRGLVPADWIVDALRCVPTDHPQPREVSATQFRSLRSLLVRTPQPVLRRILKEPLVPMTMAMRDTADLMNSYTVRRRGISEVARVLDLTGQRNIRSSTDLHNVVSRVQARPARRGEKARSYATSDVMQTERDLARDLGRLNDCRVDEGLGEIEWETWIDLSGHDRARLLDDLDHREDEAARRHAEQAQQKRLAEQAERAAWAAMVTEKIAANPTLGGLQITVATTPAELVEWGTQMRTCIGSYQSELGLDVLLGLFRDGVLVANAQLTWDEGVIQLLGKHNRDFAAAQGLGAALGRQVLADLALLGVPTAEHGWGIAPLLEEPAAA